MTASAAATLERANDWVADFGTATLTIGDGVTVAATHTLTNFVTSNNGDDALATANPIGQETITSTVNPVSEAVITGTAGKTYTLTVGLAGSGANVIVSTLNYISGQPSNVNSLVFTFPATPA